MQSDYEISGLLAYHLEGGFPSAGAFVVLDKIQQRVTLKKKMETKLRSHSGGRKAQANGNLVEHPIHAPHDNAPR
jgi:hypothetical protein